MIVGFIGSTNRVVVVFREDRSSGQTAVRAFDAEADPDFEKLISGLRINLTETGVFVFGDEFAMKRVKLVDVFCCPINKQP